jgi:AcrR family transcriptional regulator
LEAFVTAVDAAAPRRKRADAVRNTETVVEAAKAVFAESGVDAPMRDIAARAGVGVGTIYRNYPQRSDLVIAVFRQGVDDTAAAAASLAASHPPAEALRLWARQFAGFVATKRGLSAALHSGDPAFAPLPDYFLGTLGPRVQELLDAAARDSGRAIDVTAEDLITALSRLTASHPGDPSGRSERMIGVLLDGILGPAR